MLAHKNATHGLQCIYHLPILFFSFFTSLFICKHPEY